MKWSESHSVVSDCLWFHRLYSPWNSPGQNTAVGCRFLLQGIFPIQVQTQVSHIAGGFFTSRASREAQELPNEPVILLLHTSNPRTAQEVRGPNSTVKNLHITIQLALYSCSSTSTDSTQKMYVKKKHWNLFDLWWLSGIDSPANARDMGSILGSGRSSGEGNGNPSLVLLPGKSQGQRGLAGYSP